MKSWWEIVLCGKSITDGSIRIKGNIFRALSFAELLRSIKPVYQAHMKFSCGC